MGQLRQALKKIEQMSDCGSYESAIVNMKAIATEALKSTPAMEQLRWYSVEEKPKIPEPYYDKEWDGIVKPCGVQILVYDKVENAVFEIWYMDKFQNQDITLWMYMPYPPSESTPIEGITDEQLEKAANVITDEAAKEIIANQLYNISNHSGHHLLDTMKCDEIAEFILHDLREYILSHSVEPEQYKIKIENMGNSDTGITCPKCGNFCNLSKHNTCECGAQLKSVEQGEEHEDELWNEIALIGIPSMAALNKMRKQFTIKRKNSVDRGREAQDFANWIDGEGYVCDLHNDEGIKYWLKYGAGKLLTTQELYKIYQQSKL